MHTVGVKELKNKLTYYLGLAKGGDNVIVTDRGRPIAILHNLDTAAKEAGVEEKLASLAKQGKIRLPLKKGKMKPFKPIKIKGRPLSETIIEERR
jgi:antitoxin (DNA-binding transcriptional repressor) of toxin-antitoxin stability system